MSEDYYRTLNVLPVASQEEVRNSYRALARRYHPDLNRSVSAAHIMALINEAYEVLGEPVKRAAYDRRKKKDKNTGVTEVVMSAAREALIRQSWKIIKDTGDEFVLEKGTRVVHVRLMPSINCFAIRQLLRRASGFAVVLTMDAESALTIPTDSLAVIDLRRSSIVHGGFPDSVYQELFGRFLRAA